MRRLTLGGHPLHPALVHFPVVCWTVAPALDGAQFLGLWHEGWRGAYWSIAAGVILALPAMTAGLLDLLALSPEHPAQTTGQRHMLLMASAWSTYVIDLLLHLQPGPPSPGLVGLGLGLSLCGFALLVIGAYAGAQLVYDFGVGASGRRMGSRP